MYVKSLKMQPKESRMMSLYDEDYVKPEVVEPPKKDYDRLMDLLDDVSEDTIIYLGTKHGSSWLWISENREMKNIITGLSYAYHRKKVESVNKTTPTGEEEEYCKAVDADPTRRKEKGKSKYKKYKKYLDDLYSINHWVDIKERKVMDYYHRQLDRDAISVIIDGNEVGKFWRIEDVEQEKLKRKALAEGRIEEFEEEQKRKERESRQRQKLSAINKKLYL